MRGLPANRGLVIRLRQEGVNHRLCWGTAFVRPGRAAREECITMWPVDLPESMADYTPEDLLRAAIDGVVSFMVRNPIVPPDGVG